MTTISAKHQVVKDKTVQGIDGYKGESFNAFSKSESVGFCVGVKIPDPSPIANPDPENPTAFLDLSAWKLYASYTSVDALSCAAMTGSEFCEAELLYTGVSTTDPDRYWFEGIITDEQTILLPAGQSSVVGAIKIVGPSGYSTFIDKALITVSECRNPRLDQ